MTTNSQYLHGKDLEEVQRGERFGSAERNSNSLDRDQGKGLPINVESQNFTLGVRDTSFERRDNTPSPPLGGMDRSQNRRMRMTVTSGFNNH